MEREWEQLQKWAARSGLILPPGFPAPEKTESREHDVTYRSAERRWWKYTKPHGAGLAVTWEGKDRPFSHNATPLEYFDRLRAANVLLADDIRLEGLWRDPSGAWRIVTSQPDVPGANATREGIIHSLELAGWTVEPEWQGLAYETSMTFRRGPWLMADVHPANCVRTSEGVIVPIDVILAKHRP